MRETWVLLRGLARGHRHWAGFDRRLRKARQADVHCPDLPGNGDRWRERSPMRVAALTDAVRANLARNGVTPPMSVLGVSLGGMVALDWVRRFPGELRGVVLVGASSGGVCRPWHRLQPPALLGLLLGGLLARDVCAREALVLRWTSRRHPADAELRTRWAAIARENPVSPVNVLRQLAAATRFDGRGPIPAVPGLVIGGAADRLVSPGCSAALAASLGWPCAMCSGAGHDVTLDAPDWVLPRLREMAGSGP